MGRKEYDPTQEQNIIWCQKQTTENIDSSVELM
jgi:hypothetical protein